MSEYKEKRGPEGSPKFDFSLAKGGAGADADAGARAGDGARDSGSTRDGARDSRGRCGGG
jgi:hypothetical protein